MPEKLTGTRVLRRSHKLEKCACPRHVMLEMLMMHVHSLYPIKAPLPVAMASPAKRLRVHLALAVAHRDNWQLKVRVV